MSRILLAIAVLCLVAPARAAPVPDKCMSIDAFLAARSGDAEKVVVLTGTDAIRAVELYNSLPGNGNAPETVEADTVMIAHNAGGGLYLAYATQGIACTSMRIPPGAASLVMRMVMGDPS